MKKAPKKISNAKFPARLARPARRQAGVTPISKTPLAVRTSGVGVDEEEEAWLRDRMTRQLGKFATYIERVTARFEDENGPRGGVAIVCRAKVVLRGHPSVIVDARGTSVETACAAVMKPLARAVREAIGRQRASDRDGAAEDRPRRMAAVAKERGRGRQAASPAPDEVADDGSLICRRVGRADMNLKAALDRPEKRRRDAYVDTAKKGVSASDRKAGGGSTARRNSKQQTSRATATLEDSRRDHPSRKSTRKSANRVKSANKLGQATAAKSQTPKARAERSRADRPRT